MTGGLRMSVRKQKKSSDSPMPATGAGLIRFYSESDSPGLKMGPYWTVAIAIAFVGIILVINLLQP
jgi:preprotein translocase subunit Sec61beta